MLKNILKFSLIFILIAGICIMSACDKTENTKKMKLSAGPMSSKSDSDREYEIIWSDEVFTQSPKEQNATLLSCSAVLSSASFSSFSVLEDLRDLGFSKNAKFSYGENKDETKVGLVISSKKIEDFTLVTVVIRGTVQKEWYSNFDVGYSDVHAGFSSCCDFVMKKIADYLVNYSMRKDNLRFFVTGYSRGGAVANLVSKELIDKYGEENIFSYTFATPNTTKSEDFADEKYSGIFNFVNPNDIITKLPIDSWGYKKYGTTVNLLDTENESDIDDFLFQCNELAPTVEDYYSKKYKVAENQMTLYNYMMTIAKVICNEDLEENTEILVNSINSDFAPLTKFFVGNISAEDLLNGNFENSQVVSAHSSESYLTFVDNYNSSLLTPNS